MPTVTLSSMLSARILIICAQHSHVLGWDSDFLSCNVINQSPSGLPIIQYNAHGWWLIFVLLRVLPTTSRIR